MIKNYCALSLLFAIILSSCGHTAEESRLRPAQSNDSIVYTIQDSSMLKSASKNLLDDIVDKCSDSINNASKSRMLPAFLRDVQLDYTKAVFSAIHAPSPIRKLIFDKVTNCKSLQMIIQNADAIYWAHPRKEAGITVKYLEFSIRDLALSRSRQLNSK
jgi:hypothetical protein